MRFCLDGIKYNFNPEKDDNTVTQLPQGYSERNETPIQLPVELAETIKELNDDSLEGAHRMTKIDMKARLSMVETSAILAYDTLVQMKFLPKDSLFLTRQRKRISVSEEGKGREEIVRIVEGKKEHDENLNNPVKKFGLFQGNKPA